MPNGTEIDTKEKEIKDTTPQGFGKKIVGAVDDLTKDIDKEPLVWTTQDDQVITPEKLESLYPDEKDREDAIKRLNLKQAEETSGRTDYINHEGASGFFKNLEKDIKRDAEEGMQGGFKGLVNKSAGGLAGQAASLFEDDSARKRN